MTKLLSRIPERFRLRLDTWHFWVGVAYFGIAMTVVALVVAYTKIAREETTRKATAQATAAANYTQCIASRPGLRKIDRFLKGERDLAEVLVGNSQANLDATPKDDPLLETRQNNLNRLEKAQVKINSVEGVPVPTLADCRARGGLK